MTVVNAGTIGVVAGRRDELIALLTRRNDLLRDLGCLACEVGGNDEHPDTVCVAEVWTSADAHAASLRHPAVAAAIAEGAGRLPGASGRSGRRKTPGSSEPARIR